ncbi:hypothetical protein J6590_067164 [Homalodisca vitripennis]|nr:hypothetical protein J6590_067164 [Homalodisca vitripennis]
MTILSKSDCHITGTGTFRGSGLPLGICYWSMGSYPCLSSGQTYAWSGAINEMRTTLLTVFSRHALIALCGPSIWYIGPEWLLLPSSKWLHFSLYHASLTFPGFCP